MNTKTHWEVHAERHPYWAVVTWDKFKSAKPSPELLAEFFATGQKLISETFEVLESIRPGFAPRSALDFGCGVGRLLIPLAERIESVSGVDISEKMLELSRENLSARGLKAEHLANSVDALPSKRTYDLVQSFIVLQHIPAHQGIRIFDKLLERVSDRGMAVLHLTYSATEGWKQTFWTHLKAKTNGLALNNRVLTWLFKTVRGRAPLPPMLMENYPLNRVFSLLHDNGFNNIHLRPSFHGVYGLVIFAQRVPGQLPEY